MTSQKMPMDRFETFSRSFVSSYKNINAMIDTNGSDARMAPHTIDRLDTSEIK